MTTCSFEKLARKTNAQMKAARTPAYRVRTTHFTPSSFTFFLMSLSKATPQRLRLGLDLEILAATMTPAQAIAADHIGADACTRAIKNCCVGLIAPLELLIVQFRHIN